MPRDSPDQLSLFPPTHVYALIFRDCTGHDTDPILFANRRAARKHLAEHVARLQAVQPYPIHVTPRILRWEVH